MQRFLPILALPTLLLALLAPCPAHAGGGGGGEPGEKASGVFHVSPELMDNLIAWSSPPQSLEALAVEKYPEAVEAYALAVAQLYPDADLAGHFAKNYPAIYQAVDEIILDRSPETIELVGYALTQTGEDYQRWQRENALSENNLTLPLYLAKEYPAIPSVLDLMGQTPAAEGKSLLDFVKAQGGNEDEASLLLSNIDAIPVADPFADCVCWVALTFSRAPGGWQAGNSHRDSTYWDGGFRRLDFERRFNGAAREADFRRASHLRRYEVGKVMNASRTAMRMRMHCTQRGGSGALCTTGSCTGEAAARIEYGSRVSQFTESAGFFPHSASTTAVDTAILTYDREGNPQSEELFRKGVAVAGVVNMEWDADSLSNLLGGFGDILQIVTGDGGTAFDLLGGNLIDDIIQGIFGLIVWEGQPSDTQQEWYASYDTARSGAIPLLPNVTHAFELATQSETRGNGRGWRSESEASIASYDYFVTALRNFQCKGSVAPPPVQACWSYASSDHPLSIADIEGLIDAWVTTELGVSPANIAAHNGGC